MDINKRRFFIFLDIDGVMYDLKFIKERIKNKDIKNGGLLSTFKPESVMALNYLTKTLSNHYDVTLVISSTWRFAFKRILKMLIKNGVNLNCKIDKTSGNLNRFNRGKEVIDYLKEKCFVGANDDFVIIDDENFNYNKYFDKKMIIKTNILNNALSMSQVIKFTSSLFPLEKNI